MTMKSILTRMFVILLAVALILAFATQGLLWATGFSNKIDNGDAISDVLFGTVGDLGSIYNRQSLNSGASRVILVGASNFILIPAPVIERRLRQNSKFSEYKVNNMSVQGVGIPTFKRIVDLAYDAMPVERREHTIFVLGLWYGFFYRDDKGALEEGYQAQITRTHLYATSVDGDVRPFFDRNVTNWVLFFLKPFVLIDRTFQTAGDFGSTLMCVMVTGHTGKLAVSDNLKNAASMTSAQKSEAIRMRAQSIGRLHPEQFQYLRSIATKISGHGDQLVLLNLPLPQWHRDGVPAYRDFEAESDPEFKRLTAIKGVTYLNLVNALADDDFYDSVHPKHAAADRLADAIALKLTAAR